MLVNAENLCFDVISKSLRDGGNFRGISPGDVVLLACGDACTSQQHLCLFLELIFGPSVEVRCPEEQHT
jgi:hypothetical protein